MNPTISVLVPTYNRAKYIEECLESILAQTIKPAQIIVIDDGSSDSTPELLQKYANKIIYLQKENGGKSTALNYGLQFATGEYVWIFDDDDVALPDSIERRLRLLEGRNDIDFVYSGHHIGSDGADGKIVINRLYDLPVVDAARLHLALLEGCFFTQQGVLAHRRCYERLGPFNETFSRGQDYEMLIRMSRQCRGLGLVEPTFIFRRHEGARGPGSALHSSEKRDQIWMGFEHRIGRQIREELALEEYLTEPRVDCSEDWKLCRLAYLQRMSIMASKGLVEEVVADLRDAVALDTQHKLDEQSALFCRRAMTREFMQVALRANPDLFLEQVRLLGNCQAGRDALRALARGLFWVARHKDVERIGRGNALVLCMKLFWFSLVGDKGGGSPG